MIVAVGVTHSTPFVRNRKKYVHVPSGLVVVPLYTRPVVVLPPPDNRVTTLLSWNCTRDEVGTRPVLSV